MAAVWLAVTRSFNPLSKARQARISRQSLGIVARVAVHIHKFVEFSGKFDTVVKAFHTVFSGEFKVGNGPHRVRSQAYGITQQLSARGKLRMPS